MDARLCVRGNPRARVSQASRLVPDNPRAKAVVVVAAVTSAVDAHARPAVSRK